MRPLPTTHQPHATVVKATQPAATAQTLELGPLNSSPAQNRRAPGCPVQRAYPWLLISSTALAAIFCGLYLTKPVIVAGRAAGPEETLKTSPALAAASPAASQPAESLLPRGGSLPGDVSKPRPADPRQLASTPADGEATYEETNLRVQHVLSAQGPAGEDLGKIMLEVPVMYRSRSLRWTREEIARARDLMVRIGNYQEASRLIRDEGQSLLAEWNQLVGDTIPATVLRADSPSLSTAIQPVVSESLDSTQAIEIQNR